MIKIRVEGGALLVAGMDGESMKVLVEGVLKTRSSPAAGTDGESVEVL